MKVAVEGCCHGDLDAIYSHIRQIETNKKFKVDLLLICGDFQAVRNHQDLECMAVPDKYKALKDFHKYYTGEKTAPILTIVIGGNHEASNYMWELYHGGWLAPNIYYLGHAGCVQVNGTRIAGASGIFKSHDFRLGNYEKLPYDNKMIRSIYHVREFSIRQLSLLSPPQIFMSHDWPSSIEHHGDLQGLLKRKSFFRADIESGSLGSPPMWGLLNTLKPQWWFAAHLHTRFEATVVHEGAPPPVIPNPDEIIIEDDSSDVEVQRGDVVPRNPDEILLEEEEDTVEAPPPPPPPRSETKFLALDKCLPKRQFLEVIDISTPEPISAANPPFLSYDLDWLAITRAFHPWLSTTHLQRPFPEDKADALALVDKERTWIKANLKSADDGLIRISDWQNFVQTAPGPAKNGRVGRQQPPWYTNPQTESFCRMLQIENKINPPPVGAQPSAPQGRPTLASDEQVGS